MLYAVPSDAPDRFAAVAGAIDSDIAAIDQWWHGQDPTRALRWDLYAFPGCPAGLAELDLGVVRLAHPSSSYAAPDGFERLVDEIGAHLAPTEKALVFFDGAFDDPFICGESEEAPRNGGPLGISIVALLSGCGSDLGAGSYTARIAVHELVHNLGAVPVLGPPNRCSDTRVGGHVCDSETDLMYPFAFPGMTLAGAVLDIDHDDYYGHSGNWWDVQDSAWLVHLPRRTLTVTVTGPGAVSSTPAAIACGATCTATLDSDFSIRLDAAAAPGMELFGWKGACSGDAACTVTMSGDLSVRATFGPIRPRLAVRLAGRGRITSVPAGIDCPGHCTAPYAAKTTVKLRAQPGPGWSLVRWAGSCGRKPVCALVVTGDRTVAVTFTRAHR